jgi:hypothetical protein
MDRLVDKNGAGKTPSKDKKDKEIFIKAFEIFCKDLAETDNDKVFEALSKFSDSLKEMDKED